MNLRAIDLNLLVVLDALIEERNVSRAADRLELSASATSHALDRLRKLFNDPLLIRSVTGMEPTPRALELAEPIRVALQEIQRALAPPHFDPALAANDFIIAAETYETIAFLPQLIETLRREAPNLRIKIVSGSVEEVLSNIDHGHTDCAMGRFEKLPDRFMTQRLMVDDYVCAMRADHPLALKPLTTQAYLQAAHLLISLTGNSVDPLDAALVDAGFKRQIVMQQPNGLGAVMALVHTDMIATVTRGAARIFAANAALCLKELPIEVPTIELRQIWHQRLNQSPSHKWLRQKLSAIAAEVERSLRQR